MRKRKRNKSKNKGLISKSKIPQDIINQLNINENKITVIKEYYKV